MKSFLVKVGVILIGLTIFGHSEVWGADWKFFQRRGFGVKATLYTFGSMTGSGLNK